MKKKIFISYSHEDSAKAKKFSELLSLYNFDIWIDEKNISNGDNYASKIFSAIRSSDIYMVFISSASIKSKWVDAEIDFALCEKIGKKISIIPVLLDDVEMPISLSNIDYLDARFSLHDAIEELSKKQEQSKAKLDEIVMSNVTFSLAKKTSVQLNPFDSSLTDSDLIEDRNKILTELRGKAYGILMNFVSLEDFDFQSPKPRFTNGIYEEFYKKKTGDTAGSVCEYITVKTTVFNPSWEKAKKIVKEKIKTFNINSMSFGFAVPLKEDETMSSIRLKCFQKICEDYIILSYDPSDGAKIEIDEDCYLSIACSEEFIKVGMSTKYDFQFEERIKDFDVIAFIKNLLE